MNVWYLFVVMYGVGGSVTVTEFTSYNACQVAKAELEIAVPAATVVCVKRGS